MAEAGYLMLKSGKNSETMVYEFQVTIFDQPTERYRGIYLNFVSSFEKAIINTYENIKRELILYNKNLPNPATYVIETELILPIEETLLPLAKRTLVKYISTGRND